MDRLAIALLAVLMPVLATADSADWVVTDARIWTGNPDAPWATAMAGQGENILVVGDNKAVSDLVSEGSRVYRSPGKLIVPGFIDSHVHLLPSGFELSQVKLRDAATPK